MVAMWMNGKTDLTSLIPSWMGSMESPDSDDDFLVGVEGRDRQIKHSCNYLDFNMRVTLRAASSSAGIYSRRDPRQTSRGRLADGDLLVPESSGTTANI